MTQVSPVFSILKPSHSPQSESGSSGYSVDTVLSVLGPQGFFLPVITPSVAIALCSSIHQEVKAICSAFDSGLACDFHWSIECGRQDVVLAPRLGSRNLA